MTVVEFFLDAFLMLLVGRVFAEALQRVKQPTLVGALLVVAIAGKLVGGYAGARLAGFSRPDSNPIAFLLNSNGFVELVIATIAYQSGLIDLALFSVVVGIGVITTILSPITARTSMSRQLKAKRQEPAKEAASSLSRRR